MQRIIPTEYPDYPARSPLTFYGEEYRPEYVRISETTGELYDFGVGLRNRVAYHDKNLTAALEQLSGAPNTTVNFRFIDQVIGDLIRAERTEKMLNYQKFFDFVYLLHQQKGQLQALMDDRTALKTSDRTNVRRILGNIPVITSHLRVTPMGPEPNQAVNMCKTQQYANKETGNPLLDSGKKFVSQKDQCLTVYDMCRGKQDEFGVIDHTRDLLCTRYLKDKMFPIEAKEDPDVAIHFSNMDYARDGADYLKNVITQHDWQQEYKLGGKLNQWDTKYATSKYGPIDYAHRGTRQDAANPQAFAQMIQGRPKTSIYAGPSQAMYDQAYNIQAAAAANEARRKAEQLEQLRKGNLYPTLSPVAVSPARRSVKDIIAGFGPEARNRVLPVGTPSSLRRRRTPRATGRSPRSAARSPRSGRR